MAFAFFRGPRAVLLPLYGAVLGAAGAWIYHQQALPSPVAAALVAILWGALALVPHQRNPGIQVWVVLAAAMVLRCMLIGGVPGINVVAIFVAAQTVPRAALIAIAWVSRPAGEGVAYEFSSTLTTPVSLIGMLIGVAAA